MGYASTMDPFQLRLECLQLTRRLTASQQSIGKVVDFLVKHAAVAADDMWDCVLGECEKTSLNAKLNILFLIDALVLSIVDPSGISSSSAVPQQPAQAAPTAQAGGGGQQDASIAVSSYAQKAGKDLDRIVGAVVPADNWDAVRLNASSVQKVLSSWKLLGIFSSAKLQELSQQLQARKEQLAQLPSSSKTTFEPHEVLRRIEEDRERHKRLRERAWILPAKTFANCLQPRITRSSVKPSPASPAPHGTSEKRTAAKSSNGSAHSASRILAAAARAPDALDVDFEQMWETTSDLNEDDFEQIREDDAVWWGGERFAEIQRAKMEVIEAKSVKTMQDADMTDSSRIDAERHDDRQLTAKKRAASPEDDNRRRDDYDDRDRHERRREWSSRDEDAGARLAERWRPIGGSAGEGRPPREGSSRPVPSNAGGHRSRDGGARHYDSASDYSRREHRDRERDRERDRDRDRDRVRDRDRDRDRNGRRAWGPRAGY